MWKKEFFKSYIQALTFEQEKKLQGSKTSVQFVDFYHGYVVNYT
jgi:hypothetical protein